MPIKIPTFVAGSMISPILSCCMIAPAHAPSTIYVEILPYINWLNNNTNIYPSTTTTQERADFRVQVIISRLSVTHESECWHPEYYTTQDHHSTRDALFQLCVNRLKATIVGNYQLRQGNTNQLMHTSSLKGYSETYYLFARFSGDIELIPVEKQSIPQEPYIPTDDDGLHSALQDFSNRIEIDIQQYFKQQSVELLQLYFIKHLHDKVPREG